MRINTHFPGSNDYIYLCRADCLPGDIEATDLLELTAGLMGVTPDESVSSTYRGKDIGALKKMDKFNLLMKVTELAERAGKRHYLFHDLAHDMPVDAAVVLKKRMEELSSRGLWVILLVWDHVVRNFSAWPLPLPTPMLGVPVCRTEPEDSIIYIVRLGTPGHWLTKRF